MNLNSDVDPAKGLFLRLSEPSPGDMHVEVVYDAFTNDGVNRFFLNLPTTPEEAVWGGGEQYTWLDMRGRDYPMWVREQGFGRNKSSTLTKLVDLGSKGQAGGDYHTTYWPQPSFLSSRKYYFEVHCGQTTNYYSNKMKKGCEIFSFECQPIQSSVSHPRIRIL